jgi:hypothetical protein
MDLAWAAGIAAGCSVLALAGSAWSLWRSVPARVRADAELARTLAEKVRADWTRTLIEIDGLRESIEGTLEATERKRRSAAAAASKVKAANDAPPQQNVIDLRDPAQLREIARSRGLLSS